jgi:hypothetical protein
MATADPAAPAPLASLTSSSGLLQLQLQRPQARKELVAARAREQLLLSNERTRTLHLGGGSAVFVSRADAADADDAEPGTAAATGASAPSAQHGPADRAVINAGGVLFPFTYTSRARAREHAHAHAAGAAGPWPASPTEALAAAAARGDRNWSAVRVPRGCAGGLESGAAAAVDAADALEKDKAWSARFRARTLREFGGPQDPRLGDIKRGGAGAAGSGSGSGSQSARFDAANSQSLALQRQQRAASHTGAVLMGQAAVAAMRLELGPQSARI